MTKYNALTCYAPMAHINTYTTLTLRLEIKHTQSHTHTHTLIQKLGKQNIINK